jgi:gluconate 2-dehydrogenase gamma chain
MSVQTFASPPAWLSQPAKGALTQEETARLDAIFARILPSDPARHIPGAVKVGASAYVSQLLAMPFETYFEIEGWFLFYPLGLSALERFCVAQHQQKLTEIDDAKMNALIAGLEQGRLTSLTLKNDQLEINQPLLFKTLWRHCLQGCLADPRWGGNKDKLMWRAIGYLQPAEDNLA